MLKPGCKVFALWKSKMADHYTQFSEVYTDQVQHNLDLGYKPGALVHLKQRSLDSLGINGTLRGGEGKIVSVSFDQKGPSYVISMSRNGKTRVARREDLVLHTRSKEAKKHASRVRFQELRARKSRQLGHG